jgi:hypothetical protein
LSATGLASILFVWHWLRQCCMHVGIAVPESRKTI